MNLFEIVKYGVGCREAAERYGVEVNHYGMALCPFHNDRHPSLYVADDHYHCCLLYTSTYDCGSFVVNGTAVVGKEKKSPYNRWKSTQKGANFYEISI